MSKRGYAEVRDSGVAWLGEVPAHWEVSRMKHVCSPYGLYGANLSADNYMDAGIRFIRTTDITDDGRLIQGGVFLPEELVGDYMLSDGDVLISRSGTIGRAFLYDSRSHGSCCYAGYLVRFVPTSRVLPRYLFLFTKTRAFAGYIQSMAISSTIDNVNAEKYANTPLPLPALSEQAAIVAFLDQETARIDALVEKKKQQIALLKEKRIALISHAVTKGLDPNAALKDSGVEWLGKVPAGWDVKRLKFIAEVRPSGVNKHIVDGEIPIRFLGTDTVYHTGEIHDSLELEESTVSALELEKFLLLEGDIVVTKDSVVPTRIADVSIVMEPLSNIVCGYHLFLVRMRDARYISRYYYYYLASVAKGYFLSESRGTTIIGIGRLSFSAVHLLCPPKAEQIALAAFLDRETAQIDALIEKIEQAVGLLREHRVALISAAVTGKIDVRKA